MPVMNGIDASREIIKIRDGEVYIIAVTGDVTPEVKGQCLEVGIDDYIIKPIKRSEIIRIIREFGKSRDFAA